MGEWQWHLPRWVLRLVVAAAGCDDLVHSPAFTDPRQRSAAAVRPVRMAAVASIHEPHAARSLNSGRPISRDHVPNQWRDLYDVDEPPRRRQARRSLAPFPGEQTWTMKSRHCGGSSAMPSSGQVGPARSCCGRQQKRVRVVDDHGRISSRTVQVAWVQVNPAFDRGWTCACCREAAR